MQEFLSVICGDHELLNENFYLERFSHDYMKHEKIRRYLNLVNIFDIKYVDLDNAKLEKNLIHLYICYKPSVYKIKEDQDFFDEDLLSALKENKNIRIVYFLAEEAINENDVVEINQYFERKNINTEQIILYTNSSYLDFIIEKNNFKIKNFKTSVLLVGFVKKFKKIDLNFTEEKKFLFLNQNNRFKMHRFLLLSFLYEKKILEFTDWSMLINPYYLNKNIIYENYDILTKNNNHKMNEFLDYIYNIEYKRNYHESEINFKYFSEPLLIKETFLDSYINITTETFFTENNIHISEKSYKPFYFQQFPIIISSFGHVKKMKELYNYDFFDDIINHDYDDEPDHEIRIYKIFKEIERLSKIQNEVKDFYKKNRDRFEKNKKITETLEYIDESIYFYNLK